MDVTVAVFTYNRCASLKQTLGALECVHVPESVGCELIILDNQSTDDTAAMVRSYVMPRMAVRYVCEPRRGVAHARNTALAAARGEIVLCIDDDVRPPLNWIERMCAPILSGRAHAVAGGMKIAPHLERPWMTPRHRAWMASTELFDADDPPAIISANMALSRDVLSKVPGFDTELGPGALGFWEDSLFSWQIKKAGYRIASALDVVAEHHFDESRLLKSSYLDRAEKDGRSEAYVAYHWEHRQVTNPELQLARCVLRLTKWRFQRRREWLNLDEGAPEWEMDLVAAANFFKQYLLERKRPRNYEKHGLVKVRTQHEIGDDDPVHLTR